MTPCGKIRGFLLLFLFLCGQLLSMDLFGHDCHQERICSKDPSKCCGFAVLLGDDDGEDGVASHLKVIAIPADISARIEKARIQKHTDAKVDARRNFLFNTKLFAQYRVYRI